MDFFGRISSYAKKPWWSEAVESSPVESTIAACLGTVLFHLPLPHVIPDESFLESFQVPHRHGGSLLAVLDKWLDTENLPWYVVPDFLIISNLKSEQQGSNSSVYHPPGILPIMSRISCHGVEGHNECGESEIGRLRVRRVCCSIRARKLLRPPCCIAD